MVNHLNSFKNDKLSIFTIIFFIILSFWWIYIFSSGTQNALTNHAFGFVYGGFSLWGGVIGFFVARKWGGFSSLMGRALIGLSLGLLFQGFGQYSFWFYNFFLKIEVPYPGIPDIGYFATIPCYIYAGLELARSSGVKLSLSTFFNKMQVILIPLVMLSIAYALFLKDYNFDSNDPFKTFLDFAYPLGQAIYVSIAILTFSLSRKILGGIMRGPILFIVFAFSAQFLADYIFIYFHDLYFPASFIDYFYLLAYFIMSMGILRFKIVINGLRSP